MNERDLERMRDYLDGRIEPEELNDLNRLLESDPEARARFRAMATLEEGLRDLAALAPEAAKPVLEPGKVRMFPALASALLRPVAAAVAGILAGVLGASAVWAYASPSAGRVISILRDGFEVGPVPGTAGLPREAGNWNGDFSEVVGSERAVTPLEGGKMLRLLRADYQGKPNPEGNYCADLFRLIDLRPYRRELADGAALAQVAAGFNAVPFPEQERYTASVTVFALTAEMVLSETPLTRDMFSNAALAMARKTQPRLDRDPGSWEEIDTELRLPADTDFLFVHLGIIHGSAAQRRSTFEGHYLDGVRVTLVRRPVLP